MTSPPWATGKPQTLGFGKPAPSFSDCDGREPYNVGKSRARAHLKLALSTEDKEAQLRRLEQALDSNRFDRRLARELESAENQAKELALKLGKRPASARGAEDAQPGNAAPPAKPKKLAQKKEAEMSSTVRQPEDPAQATDAEMEAAATKIQAIQRGKQTRRNMAGTEE